MGLIEQILQCGKDNLNEGNNKLKIVLPLFEKYIVSIESSNIYIEQMLHDFSSQDIVKQNAEILFSYDIKLSLGLYYWLAINCNDEKSQKLLGQIFIGEFNDYKVTSLAIYFFKMLKENNPSDAYFYLGWVLYSYENSKLYSSEIIECFSKASALKNKHALYNLGVIYREGEIVAKDDVLSERYFFAAKNNGHIFSEYNLDTPESLKKNKLKTKTLNEYFIFYFDLLGYKNEIKHLGEEHYLKKIDHAIYNIVYSPSFEFSNPYCVTFSKNKILYRMFSDNAIIAIKKTNIIYEDIINLNYLFRIVSEIQINMILCHNLFIRGSLTIGNLYFSNRYIYGSGLIKAYTLESIANNPFVLVDKCIVDFLKDKTVENIKIKTPTNLQLIKYIRYIFEKSKYYGLIKREDLKNYFDDLKNDLKLLESGKPPDRIIKEYIESTEKTLQLIVGNYDSYFFKYNSKNENGYFLDFLMTLFNLNGFFLDKTEPIKMINRLKTLINQCLDRFSNNATIYYKYKGMLEYITSYEEEFITN